MTKFLLSPNFGYFIILIGFVTAAIGTYIVNTGTRRENINLRLQAEAKKSEKSEIIRSKVKVLTALILEGDKFLGQITDSYYQKREDRTFNEVEDIPIWQNQYNEWYSNSLKKLNEIFPNEVKTVQFKNEHGSQLTFSGQNIKWQLLNNTFKAKISVLNEFEKELSSSLK